MAAIFYDPVGTQGLDYARPYRPYFSSLRERAPFGSLAALRDRGLVRRLTRSNTLILAEKLPIYGSLSVFYEPVIGLAEMVIAKEAVVG